MGSKGSQTSTTSSSLPPQVLQNYQNVTAQAANVASTPYQAYSGQLVAPTNSTQNQATSTLAGAQTAYQPYFNQAQSMISNGTQAITPTTVNSADISQYESPYNQQVINATQAQLNQNDAVQQQQLTGNAIAAGAFGGDRAAVAASTLAGQQDLANNQTIAGLENQNYSQALGEANTQQQVGMTAQQANAANQLSAAGLTGALGNYSTQNQVGAANSLLNAGTTAQTTAQNQDTAAYQQFESALAYPFQTTQYEANIDEGLGNQGGTSSTTSPAPNNTGSELLGAGMLAASFFKKGGSVDGYASGGEAMTFPTQFSFQDWVPSGSISGHSGVGIPNAPRPAEQSSPLNQPGMMTGMKTLGGQMKGIANSSPTDIDADQPSMMSKIESGIGNFLNGTKNIDAPASSVSNVASDLPVTGMQAYTEGTPENLTNGDDIVAIDADQLPSSNARGGSIKGYASGGILNEQNIPLTYLLGNQSLGTNMNSIMGGGYGGALSGLGPSSAGYKNGGAPEGYQDAGAVLDGPSYVSFPPSMMPPALPGTGIAGYNPSSSLSSNINSANPIPNVGNMSTPISGGQSYAPGDAPFSFSGQSSVPISGGMSTPAVTQSDADTNTDSPLQVSSSSNPAAPPALSSLEQQLQKNEPVLDSNEALRIAGASMLAGRSHYAGQNIGEGILAGMQDYASQKQGVREYGLKEAEAEKQAQQMQIEADRYAKQEAIEQENADTNKNYKDIVAQQAQNGKTPEMQEWEMYQKAHAGESPDSIISGFTKQTAKPGATSGTNISSMFNHPETATDPTVTGMAVLNDIKDPNQKAMAQSILDHTANLNDFSMRGSDREQMAGVLHRIDPNYDEHDYSNIGAALKAYNANGNIGKVNNSYSTVIQHIGEALPQAKALDNQGVWTPANSITNYIANNSGDPRVKVLDSTLNSVASEMAKALNPNGVVSDSAREEQRKNLESRIDSTGQISSVLKNLANLGRDKINTNQEQYLADAGDSDFRRQKADTFITPEARGVLNNLGIPVKSLSGQRQAGASQTSTPSTAPAAPPISGGMLNLNDPKVKAAMQAGYSVSQIKQHYGLQ